MIFELNIVHLMLALAAVGCAYLALREVRRPYMSVWRLFVPPFLACGVAFGLVLIAVVAGKYAWELRADNEPFALAYLAFAGVLAAWTGFAFYATFSEYSRLRAEFENGHATFVEGEITNFESLPKMERFCVRSACFSYSQYVVSAAFNRTARTGGPLANSLWVRIWYVDRQIVRLEVARPRAP